MFKLKLIKGRSYTGHGVKATAAAPYVTVGEKEVANALAASRYFSLVDAPAPSDDGNDGDKPLEKMTEKELEAYAAENGIDLSGVSKKADKLAAIQQAFANEGAAGGLFTDEV